MPGAPDIMTERLETLILARLSTTAKPQTPTAIAIGSHRYAPGAIDAAGWRERVAACLRGLQDRQLVDVAGRIAGPEELTRRTGGPAGKRWQQWSARILPGLALGIRADDARSHERLSGRDAWAAAIVARVHQLWTGGPPPTVSRTCDALTWRALGLGTAPKPCPAEIRAHFLRTYLEIDTGPPERLLRQLAAQAIGAARPDLTAFHAALIRTWLTGGELGTRPEPDEPSLIDAVRRAAQRARDGVFGDRKVFIASVWTALRTTPPWAGLELDDFKARLLLAFRRQELELARADLVAAMDPALVAASETRTDGAMFHFIVREPVS